MTEQLKTCPTCQTEFEGPHANRVYCQPACRWKVKARKPQSARSVDPEQRYAYWLKYRYGLTQEQYDDLLLRQGGGCAICGKTPQESKIRLAVDHDHVTGEVRGVLCSFCNHRVLGRQRDPNLLRRMADYLEVGTGWFIPPKKKRRRKPRKAKK